MQSFVAGVLRFKNEVYPGKRALFEKLAQGQAPEALFITCSDARIDANLITQTDPGSLFICRNAGGIIPPHTHQTGAMTASIEFAVGTLNVKHIVVCGHAECGAMRCAMEPDRLHGLEHVSKWLAYADAAVRIAARLGEGKTDAERMKLLVEQNVILQIRHLATHPTVAERLATGDIEIHGWYYDIKTGEIEAYDEAANAFLPIEERYRLGG